VTHAAVATSTQRRRAVRTRSHCPIPPYAGGYHRGAPDAGGIQVLRDADLANAHDLSASTITPWAIAATIAANPPPPRWPQIRLG